MKGITNATAVSGSEFRTCARLSSGSLKCWGTGDLGGAPGNDGPLPVAVSGIEDAIDLSAGASHNCATRTTGRVSCWGGYNYFGLLGNGTFDESATPVDVAGITSATQASAGGFSGCARLANATVQRWGSNYNGELGQVPYSDTPVRVVGT